MRTGQTLDEFPDFNDLFRVEAHSGLVENEDRRIMQQGLCQSNTLPIATGEVPDQSVPHSTQLKSPDGLVKCRGECWSCHATELSDEGQIFGDGQFLVDRRRFR